MSKADMHAARNSGEIRYITEFVRARCSAELCGADLFPNAKEITETMGMFHAIKDHVVAPSDLGDPSIVVVVPGDGHTPRTAATIAAMSRWTCHSVDPAMRDRQSWTRLPFSPKRLRCHRVQAAEMPMVYGDRVIVAAVHSHAPLADVLSRIDARRVDIVAIPCCVPQTLEEWSSPTHRAPDKSFSDKFILSPQRRVDVWLDAGGAS